MTTVFPGKVFVHVKPHEKINESTWKTSHFLCIIIVCLFDLIVSL